MAECAWPRLLVAAQKNEQPVSAENLELTCDRLSSIVDQTLFERLAWERNIGPKLVRLVDLARAALETREEFELSEEGATRDVKRFIIKIHGTRVFAIDLTIEEKRAILRASEIDRSRFKLDPGEPIVTDADAIDLPWMVEALDKVFSRVKRRQQDPAERAGDSTRLQP